MNYRRAGTVYVKELVDILRDRRTLVAMILVPIVLYPLIMLGGIQAVSTHATDIENEKIIIGVERRADWENVIKPLLEEEQAIVNRMRAAARARGTGEQESDDIPIPLAEILGDPKATAQLDGAVRQHDVDCGVIVEDPGWAVNDTADPIVLKFKFQPENARGEFAARRLKDALQRVAEHRLQAQLQALNVDPRIVEPIVITDELLTTSGSILGLILPLVLVLMTITGAIYPAIDLTAGERERGTLESLMACPVPVIDLIVGKFLVVTTISIAGAALNLASVTATVYFGGFEQALETQSASNGGGFPIHVFPVILLCLIPFAVFMSAVMIAVCSCARTFKEAQNYVTPLIIAVVVAGGIAALPGAKLAGVIVVTPVANMVLLTRELLSGVTIAPATFAWVLLSTSLYAATAVAIAAQVFGRESVVFADSISLSALFNRRIIRPHRYPSLTGVGLYTALLFPIWFHVQGLLQLAGDSKLRSVLIGAAILMPVFFVAIPLAILKFRKVNTTATFTLAVPNIRYVAAAVLIGLSAWVPTHEIFVLQENYLASPPAIGEMNKALVTAVQAMPVAVVFLVMAIVPALSEELFFRGFLLSGLRSSMRSWTSIVCCGAAFGVFHFFIFKFVATAALGIVLGWLCWRSRSIWPAVLAHALHNGLLVASVLWPTWQDRIGITPDDPWTHLPLIVLLPGAALFLVGLVLTGWSPAALSPAPAHGDHRPVAGAPGSD